MFPGHISLGALGDSFYEYLLKAWLVSGQTDDQARVMFDTAMQAALDKMLRFSPSGLAYLAELKYGRIFEEKMDHLSCFAGMKEKNKVTLYKHNTNRYTKRKVSIERRKKQYSFFKMLVTIVGCSSKMATTRASDFYLFV